MKEHDQHPTLPDNWAFRFFTIWSGQAISLFGSSLVQFALVWYLTKESGSATVLAMATLVAMLPQILLGPLAGAYIDRHDRRKIIMVADGAIMLATIGLVLIFAAGRADIWHIYVVMFVRGLGGAFHWPAMQASTSLMVPNAHLARIAGMNQTLQGAISIIAPPLGAVLIEVMSTQNVLLIDVGTAFIAILPLFFIPIPQPARTNGVKIEETRLWQDMKEGFAYVRNWPGLLAIITMAAMINFLLTPTSSLAPLLVTKHFNGGALQFGLLDSFWGVGMILGGVTLTVWGGFKQKIKTSMVGMMGIGVGIILVGAAPSSAFYMALVGMFIVGMMLPFANGPLMAIIQSIVPPDMQGRVMSLLSSAAMGVAPLGLLVAGPVSDWLGIRIWYWISGGLTLLIGISAFFIPAIMNVENNRNGE